ncbi:MAG: hypothetical protein ACE5JP_16815 [Candidatus Bipolaricaulia bacterium]
MALISSILSIYFTLQTQKAPKLTYAVHPIKTVIFRSGELSDLHLFHRGREINSDVTVAQVAIWNQGKESIRPENVLSEVKIITQPQVPILEATIHKQSRSVIEFSSSNSQLADGVIPLSWKILEQNDEAVVQVIYAGSPETAIVVEGIVEGQQRVFAVESSARGSVSLANALTIAASTMYFMTLVFMGLQAWFVRVRRPRSWIWILLTLLLVLNVPLLTFSWLGMFKMAGPPFGF